MLKTKRFIVCLLAVALVFSVAYSCAQIAETKRGYLNTRTIFNEGVKVYLADFELAPEEQKAEWARDISPIIVDAEQVLDAWGAAIKAGADPYADYQQWILIQRKLLRLGFKWWNKLQSD